MGKTICVGTSSRWYEKIWNRNGRIPEGNIEQKVEILASFIENAQETIKMVTGEFSPKVFDTQPVVDALSEAVARGVDVQILLGDRGWYSGEGITASLCRRNSNLVSSLLQELRSGDIRIFYGPRPERHFCVFDDDGVIMENEHPPYISLPWSWKKGTFFTASGCSAKFGSIQSKMKQVYFPSSIRQIREDDYDY